jgi:hypothetical protein
LCLFGSTLEILLKEDTDSSVQIQHVFICPTEPLISAIQRVHTLYYHYGAGSGRESLFSKL